MLAIVLLQAAVPAVPTDWSALPPLPYLVPLVGMWGMAMGLIIFQRDLGAALLLFSVFLAMLYVATNSGWYVIAGLTAFSVGLSRSGTH